MQADKEQALKDGLENEHLPTCTPQVLLLLHNLASSASRTASRLVQALRTATPAVLRCSV